MYYSADYDQLPLEDFFLPFGGSLDPKNRWVKLSRIMPWEKIVQSGDGSLIDNNDGSAIIISQSENRPLIVINGNWANNDSTTVPIPLVPTTPITVPGIGPVAIPVFG